MGIHKMNFMGIEGHKEICYHKPSGTLIFCSYSEWQKIIQWNESWAFLNINQPINKNIIWQLEKYSKGHHHI